MHSVVVQQCRKPFWICIHHLLTFPLTLTLWQKLSEDALDQSYFFMLHQVKEQTEKWASDSPLESMPGASFPVLTP